MKKIIGISLLSLLLISSVILFRLFFSKRKKQQKTLVQSQIQTVPDFRCSRPSCGTSSGNLKEIVADQGEAF